MIRKYEKSRNYKRMTVQCGGNSISQRKAYKCKGRFKSRHTTVNIAHSVMPSIAVHDEVMEEIDDYIQDNRRIGTDETTSSISYAMTGTRWLTTHFKTFHSVTTIKHVDS
jgi:hypothetical protein